jgi:hypothetical protein
MADYTDNALLSCIKALDNVVLPAVDPADPLASEQLRLVSGFMKFLRSRLPYWQARQFFELHHYLGLARSLAADARLAPDEVSQRMDSAIEQANAVQLEASPPLAEIRAATAALAAPISALVRVVAKADPGLRQRVEQKILSHSKQWVDMQRTWFLPQGFELRAGELPSLDDVLTGPAPTQLAAG